MRSIFKKEIIYIVAFIMILFVKPIAADGANTKEINNGTHIVPVTLYKETADEPSIGNNAFEQRAKLVVDDEKTILHIGLKDMQVGNLTGYLSELSVYENYPDTSNKTEATVISIHEAKKNPKEITIPIDINAEFIGVEMKIPVMESMGMGSQTARIKLDYDNITEFENIDTSLLVEAISSASIYSQNKYTSESYQLMIAKTNEAKEMVDFCFPSQTDIDNLSAELKQAINDLNFSAADGRYTIEGAFYHATNDTPSMAKDLYKSAELEIKNNQIKVILNTQAMSFMGQTAYLKGLKYFNGTDYIEAEITDSDTEGNVFQLIFTLPVNKRFTDIKMNNNGNDSNARLFFDFESSKEIVSKDELIAKIATSKTIAKGSYTDGSYQALQTAISNAEAILNSSVTQAQINDALNELNIAIQGLTKIAPTIKLDKVSAAIFTQGANNSVKITPTVTGDSNIVTWTSSNTSVAAVSNGTVTGKKAGTATITAASNGVTATCIVTVKTASVSLNKTKATIYTAGTTKITLKATVKGATTKATWKTSNSKVASVKNGVVTAKKAGTATITVSANGIIKTCKITVKKPTLTVSKSKITVKKGKTVKIVAKATPSNKITYKTSNKKVATVSNKGVVKGIKKGKVKITVSCNKLKKTVTVTVK